MIIGYSALHYGSCYLPWAIRSIIDHVDEYHVLYSAHGSHGTRSMQPLPESESRENLHRLAKAAARDKLVWHDGDWLHEGEQRDAIYQLAPDADMILVLDYDEIWTDVADVIETVKGNNHHFYRLSMIHYWRSFSRAIMNDPAYPVRVICPKREKDITFVGTLEWGPIINHMGYAIPNSLMEYKRPIHGHRAEWRTDIDWWTERWQNPDADTDLHPVGSEHWNYMNIYPGDYLPEFMKLHPFWGLDRIV